MNLGWEAFGGWRIFAIAVVYALFGLLLAEHFSRKRGFAVPTGIMAAFRGEFFLMDSGSEAGRFFSLCVNHLLIAVGAVLFRRAFAVFGGIGTSIYIGIHRPSCLEGFRRQSLFPLCAFSRGVCRHLDRHSLAAKGKTDNRSAPLLSSRPGGGISGKRTIGERNT